MSTLSGLLSKDTDINLGGGTVLTANQSHYDTFSTNRALTFSSNLSVGGPPTVLRVHATSAVTLTIPSSYRLGSPSNPITSLSLNIGDYELSWINTHGQSWLVDTSDDSTVVGRALLQLPTPSVVSLAQINNDGSVSEVSALPAALEPAHTGDVTNSAGSLALALANTAVTPGSYTNSNITVDAKGRITAASTGSTSGADDSAFDSSWNGSLVAPTKNSVWDIFGASINYSLSAYAAGTAYSLTNSDALIHFGTTDPTKVLDKAGTYLLWGRANLKYNAATYAANQTATIHLRRTNNTASDITNATSTEPLGIVTTVTDSAGIIPLPPVIYSTTNVNDSISVYGSVSATPSAGSVDVTEASILALKLYDVLAPTLSSATISSDGTTFTLVFNQTVSIGSGGNGGFALSLSSGSSTPSYTSGSGGTTLIYTLGTVVNSGVTGTLAYTQPGNGIEGNSGADVVSFSGFTITNNSTQTGYLVNQNFEGTGYDNGETWVATGTVDPDYTTNAIVGSQSCYLGGLSSNTYTTFTGQTDCWAFGRLRFVGGTLGPNTPWVHMVLADSGASILCAISFSSPDIGTTANVYIYANGSSSSASASTLALNTNYYWWLHFVSGGTCTAYISTSSTRPTTDGSGNVVLTKTAASGTAARIYLYNRDGHPVYDHILVSANAIGNNP